MSSRSRNLLLDKSAFQAISWAEHARLERGYILTVPPVLIAELVGDLSREFEHTPAPAKVAELARKFGGSGDPVMPGWATFFVASLTGSRIPMDGRIVLLGDEHPTLDDGSPVIVPSPLNRALMRWARGDFSEHDGVFAKQWRTHIDTLGADDFWSCLARRHVVVPRPKDARDAVAAADLALKDPVVQRTWLGYTLDRLGAAPRWRDDLVARPVASDLRWAPYVHHVARAHIAVALADRYRLFQFKPSNYVDAQYLYYLPFCHEFASDDRLHRFIAPPLLRADQGFHQSADIKKRLAEP